MMYKILNSDYNEETGISKVSIVSKYGEFSAIARLDPEDKELEYDSAFFGCQLAEARCYIKLLKEKLKQERLMLKTLLDLNKKLAETNCSLHPRGWNVLRIEKEKMSKTIGETIGAIEKLEKSITARPDVRIKCINELRKKKTGQLPRKEGQK